MQKIGFLVVLILLVAGVGFFQRHAFVKAVAGTGIFRGMYAQATISLPQKDGVVGYNIYYKQVSDASFIYSVRNIPPTVSSYTISYLKKNGSYSYKVATLDKSGKENWWSDVKPLSPLQPM